MNIVSTSIYFMAVLKETKVNLKWFIPLVIYAIFKVLFNQYDILFFILDFVLVIGLPLLINIKRWKYILIGCGLNLLFQLISQITKNIGFSFVDEYTLIFMILNIDYYIMLILYYLYNNRKERI